jgi:hypothetical protein
MNDWVLEMWWSLTGRKILTVMMMKEEPIDKQDREAIGHRLC